MTDELHPDTLLLHAGQQVDPTTGARAVPIYIDRALRGV
ncbi:MAG: hypothetical protein RL701_3925 [Pseudomonadota bacterium]|jgi:O-acetylhomoserine/O-acetylserine sulfhydrylase-like pyridoxal-dependent enzyme